MASLRTWRTAAATLLLVALATTSTTAAASTRTPGHQQAHYCKQVDAYRIKTCAKAILIPHEQPELVLDAHPRRRPRRACR